MDLSSIPAPEAGIRGLLDGRVAIVTGSSGALGQAIYRSFTAAGASVVGVDIVESPTCDLVVDAATAHGADAMVAEAVGRHGRLDALVLNAGVQYVAPIADFPEDQWDRLMDVMVKGPFLAIRAAWPALIAQPSSRVLVTSSVSGLIAERYKSAYVAAKHAVLGLMKVAALEGGPHGLTANAIAPGWMSTPMLESQLPEQMQLRGFTREQVLEQLLDRQPVKRLIDTSEVADLLTVLASDLSSAVSGTCIPIDLGTLAS